MTPRFLTRIIGIGLALLLVLGIASPGHAQDSDAITVIQSDVQPEFPDSITFSLIAESSAARITEVQLLYGASRSQSLTVVNAIFTPGQQIEATHQLDTQVFHVPVGVELTYRWIIQDSDGNEIETPRQTFDYLDDRFVWDERTSQGVSVYWYRGGNEFGDELIETTERALENLQRDIGATVVDPVSIYIYADTTDMRAALQSNEVEWVGGQAQPGLGLIIGAISPGDTSEVRRIIPHELSHQVLHQATENPYGGVPLWFEEGLAVYNQETHLDYHEFLLDEAARTGDLIPLEALAASFPTDPDRASLSYAQSHSVVRYIIDTYGADGMKGLVNAWKSAIPIDEAVTEALGLTVDELDAAWRQTLPKPERIGTSEPTPQVHAPANRFNDEPVVPSSNGASTTGTTNPMPTLQSNDTSPLIPGMVLPLWAELGLALGCCTVLITLIGGTVLIILRLVGVDKRS